MPHETSLALSIAFSALYAVLFARHWWRQDGLGRIFVLGMLASLWVFWTARAVAYGLLLSHSDVAVVNELLRWSAYAVALPGVWVAAMELRHRV